MDLDVRTAAVVDDRQSARRWDRLTPLTGIAFFVLLLASAITGGETPTDYAPGATVLALFGEHQNAQRLSNLLAGLGVVFLVFFAGWFRSFLRSHGADTLASAAFGGAVILAVGGAARAGIGWALASGHDELDPGAAQALNVVFAGHYPAVTGIAVLMFASGVAVLRTRALPQWLGWAALPVGLLAIAPPTLIPLIASGLWISVAGVVAYLRGGRAPRPV